MLGVHNLTHSRFKRHTGRLQTLMRSNITYWALHHFGSITEYSIYITQTLMMQIEGYQKRSSLFDSQLNRGKSSKRKQKKTVEHFQITCEEF